MELWNRISSKWSYQSWFINVFSLCILQFSHTLAPKCILSFQRLKSDQKINTYHLVCHWNYALSLLFYCATSLGHKKLYWMTSFGASVALESTRNVIWLKVRWLGIGFAKKRALLSFWLKGFCFPEAIQWGFRLKWKHTELLVVMNANLISIFIIKTKFLLQVKAGTL